MQGKGSQGQEIIIRCCSCQKILNVAGEWQDLKLCRRKRKETLFSHSVCPVCIKDLYPEFLPAAGMDL